MNYKASIRYLESFRSRGMKLGLSRVHKLLDSLDDPQRSYLTIHIAGTNGKGSVAAMLSSILTVAGYRTGLYTSPHLVDYTERIRVNEMDISKVDLAKAISTVNQHLNKMPKLILTEFEVITAAAFIAMRDAKVDIAVIEVGLGGRLDATNVIRPVISIITNIGMDHTDMLGNSIESIAREKAGIIKRGVPVVTAASKGLLEIKKACIKNNAPLIHSINTKVKIVTLNGEHQKINTALAVCAVNVLKQKGIDVSDEAIDDGLRNTFWPGRLQVVSRKPFVVVDGAHNEAGAKALMVYLRTLKKRPVFILGMQRNKDIVSYLNIIKKYAKAFVFVRSQNPLSCMQEVLISKLGAFKGIVTVAFDNREALSIAGELGNVICVTGSLYLLGDIFKEKLFDLKRKISV